MHAELPAAIKLLAGCVQKLRRAAQLEREPALRDMCGCQACQKLAAFCEQPKATAEVQLQSQQQAQHVIRCSYMRFAADHATHFIVCSGNAA